MKFFYSLFCLFFLGIVLSSCGVIFNGSRYNASAIAKNHPKATVSINGMATGKGMAMGSFNRKDPIMINVIEEDCKPQTWYFNPKAKTGTLILSTLGFGMLGLVIDLATGACYQPDYKGNPMIERVNKKQYVFSVDYRGCDL